MFTVCFVITSALWPSFAVTVVVSAETVHAALSFPFSEVQALVFLILCHFLLFYVNINVYQTLEFLHFFEFFGDSSSSLKDARLCALFCIAFVLFVFCNFPLLSISFFPLLFFLFYSFEYRSYSKERLPRISAPFLTWNI